MYFPKKFNVNDAVEVAQLVSLAYEQFEAFEGEKSWSLPKKYTLVCELFYDWRKGEPLDKKSSKLESFININILKKKEIKIPIGFVAKAGTRIFVIFRGTQTAKEWVNNLNQKLRPFFIPDFGSVHEGFNSTYLSLRGTVTGALQKHTFGKILIGGHSLGAAFAAFAMIDIEFTIKKRVTAMYTFGSPRIGSNQFVQAFNKTFASRSFRIVNTSDIVTSIPFPVSLGGFVGGYFSHVDTPVDFTLQSDELEMNHHISTYYKTLLEHKRKFIFW